jgi:hypothetical protein
MGSLPELVFHSQDEMAQLFNEVGFYRLGLSNRSVPAPLPEGITSSEWNAIWHLTRSAKARSALQQEIAAWKRSTAEARTAGRLGDRPLIVLSGEDVALPSEYRDVRMELETDLARLSAQGKLVALPEKGDDLIYRRTLSLRPFVRLSVMFGSEGCARTTQKGLHPRPESV